MAQQAPVRPPHAVKPDAVHLKLAPSTGPKAGGDGTPTAEQVEIINTFTLKSFAAAELYTREFVLAHNCIDRDREAIDEGLLDQLAKTILGKGFFLKHPMSWDGDSGPGEGRWFESRIEKMPLSDARTMLREPNLRLPPDRTQVHLLMASAYMVRNEHRAKLIADIDAGVASDVSISFTAAGEADVINPATGTREACRLLGPGEAREGSIVWLGAQPGARAIKHAKETAMDPIEKLKALLGPFAGLVDDPAKLKQALDEGTAATAKLKGLQTALGEHAKHIDSPTTLVALIGDGVAAKSAAIEELITADRLAGALGDDEASVTAAKAEYAGMTMATLKRLADRSKKTGSTPATGSVQGSDPNKQKAVVDGDQLKVADAFGFDA